MTAPAWVVVGIDNGGTSNNATVLDPAGTFRVDHLVEVPSRVTEGPEIAVDAMVLALETVLAVTSTDRSAVRAVGLDTPGPASADGVISSRGATNFSASEWWGFDIRGALEERLGLPVVYNNDGNAAALYAHHEHFGAEAVRRASVSAIVGTGLGGGVVERGQVVRGAAGMAGELGHIRIPLDGILEPDQPPPRCNCGNVGDVESIASLTGILNNLLPYWLSRHPDHPLAAMGRRDAAKAVRGLAVAGDELALAIFAQQADGPRSAVHHRRELHRPARLLRRRRRGRGRAALPRLVPRAGPGRHRPPRGADPARHLRRGPAAGHGGRARRRGGRPRRGSPRPQGLLVPQRRLR